MQIFWQIFLKCAKICFFKPFLSPNIFICLPIMDTGEIYLMYINELAAYKIGVSKNSKKRIKQLQTGCPYTIELLTVYNSTFPFKIEKAIHRSLIGYKLDMEEISLYGEWYAKPFYSKDEFIAQCIKYEKNLQFLMDENNFFLKKNVNRK